MSLSSPLAQAFYHHPAGLCGHHDPAAPLAQIERIETRLQTITFVSLLPSPNMQVILTQQSHWLFDSTQVAYKTSQQVSEALHAAQIRTPKHISRVWWQICRGIQGRFKGSIRTLLQNSHNDARAIQTYLSQSRTTFPVLSAQTTSARWLDMLHRIGGIELTHWDELREPLTAKQQKSARQFGFAEEHLHPSLALALRTWTSACHRRDVDTCGLKHCPRHA